MILSKQTILEYIREDLISVKPHFDEKQLRPFGLRVHLGDELLIPEPGQKIDLANEDTLSPVFKGISIASSSILIRPGDFILASTVEAFKIHPSLVCRIDGRSTLARLGLVIHCSAQTIDNNHKDYRSIVLEIANIGPFEINVPHLYGIGMIMFEMATTCVDPDEEQEQYKNQIKVMPPNLRFSTPKFSLNTLSTTIE